jgi:hypothetical protein
VRLRAELAATLAAAAIPYGYTIAVWSSGAVLMHTHGTPTVAEVFAFIGGGLTGYAVVWLFARGDTSAAASLGDAADRGSAGVMNWLATGAAVGAAALLAEIHGWEAWPLGAAAATGIYLVGASVQLAVVTRARGAR